MRGGIRSGDENRFAGKSESEIGEHGLEGVLRKGHEADEKAAGGSRSGGRVEVGIGLRGGHRAIWTSLFRLAPAQV